MATTYPRFTIGDSISISIRWCWWRHPIRRARQIWREFRAVKASRPLIITAVNRKTGTITMGDE